MKFKLHRSLKCNPNFESYLRVQYISGCKFRGWEKLDKMKKCTWVSGTADM
jgi:hypothetical protein